MNNYLEENYDLNDPFLVSIIDELPLWSAPFGLKLLNTVILKPNMNILDIGCGTGFPLIELANRLGQKCRVYGIDPWERAIERIQLKIKTQNLTNVTVVNGKAEDMPFEGEFFHLIVSNNGINNVENSETVLAECFRVSRSGAQMVITVNLSDTMIEFYTVFEETLKEQGKLKEVEKMKAHIYKKRTPLDTTISMINKAGFRVIQIYEDSFYMRYLDGTAMFNHFFIKLAFLDSWKKILSPADREPIFEILEQKLNKISKRSGVLNLTIPYVCIDCQKSPSRTKC